MTVGGDLLGTRKGVMERERRKEKIMGANMLRIHFESCLKNEDRRFTGYGRGLTGRIWGERSEYTHNTMNKNFQRINKIFVKE